MFVCSVLYAPATVFVCCIAVVNSAVFSKLYHPACVCVSLQVCEEKAGSVVVF